MSCGICFNFFEIIPFLCLPLCSSHTHMSTATIHTCTHMQIAKRRRAHQEAHPDAKIISLGIGDTTEPLPPAICKALTDAAAGLGTREGYSG